MTEKTVKQCVKYDYEGETILITVDPPECNVIIEVYRQPQMSDPGLASFTVMTARDWADMVRAVEALMQKSLRHSP